MFCVYIIEKHRPNQFNEAKTIQFVKFEIGILLFIDLANDFIHGISNVSITRNYRLTGKTFGMRKGNKNVNLNKSPYGVGWIG